MTPTESFLAQVAALAAILRRPVSSLAHLGNLTAGAEALRSAPMEDRRQAAAELLRLAPEADGVLLLSLVADITGDLGYYEQLLDILEPNIAQLPLEALNHIYWCMTRQFFLMRMDMESRPRFFSERLFSFYEKFVDQIGRRHLLTWPRRPVGAGSTGRVMLVTNQFLSLTHQPSRDLASYAALLEDRCGHEVMVLNTNMLPREVHTRFVPSFYANVNAGLHGEQTQEMDGRTLHMVSSTLPHLSAEKLGLFLHTVARFDPDVVVGLGSSTIVADLLAGVRPTLNIPTTSGTSVSLADIVLDFGGGSAPATGPLAGSWRPFRFLHNLAGDAPRSQGRSRAAFGLPETGVLFVVVGHRLDLEVDLEFQTTLEAALARVANAAVVFAGEVTGLRARLAASPHADRFHCLGFVDDMGALLALCDVYVNPRRTGGGGSGLEALLAGAVPVTLPVGDVAAVAGREFTVPDYPAMVERLVQLAEEPAVLAAARRMAQEVGARRSSAAETAADLSRYLEEAVARFAMRPPRAA